MNRRVFISTTLLGAGVVSTGIQTVAKSLRSGNAPAGKSFPIHIFSKHLQWLSFSEMADAAAESGADGLDITVRPGGHVLPEKVAQDLPEAVRAAQSHGLAVDIITTAITDAEEPFAQDILHTAARSGIGYYRMGWIKYNFEETMSTNLAVIQSRLEKLAELNRRYKIHGGYQNHSGSAFGSAVIDLANVLHHLDPDVIGSQYDICHATVEGANSWPIGSRLLAPYIRTIDIKDFRWTKKNGKWATQSVPLGEGMVDFGKFFDLLRKLHIDCPLSMHFEYPLGGAEHGASKVTMGRKEVLASMRKDIQTLRAYLQQ